MKASDHRERSEAELTQRLADEQRELTDLRFKRAVAGLDSPIVLRDKRREIARIQTILAEKKREAGA